MSAGRLAGFLLAALWAIDVQSQLVVRDDDPRVANPADQVPYPSGAGNCNNTIADAAARAVLGAIDRCPIEVFESRSAYYAYARQAVVGLLVPGATEAAGLLALDKAKENALFCISGALIDSSGAGDTDKAFLKSLLKQAKEISDRVELAGKLTELGTAFRERGMGIYTGDGEVNSFVNTLDVQIRERQEGVGIKPGPGGQLDPAALSTEGELVAAGQARYDTLQARANAATEQARALGRECRYGEADTALASAQQLNLAYLAELRADVSRTKHLRYCIERDARLQQRNALDPVSPFLQHSLQDADADIAQAERLDAELTQSIGEFAELQQSFDAQRNTAEQLKQRAASQLQKAGEAASQCNWARATRELSMLGTESLQCALQLDAERKAREQLITQIDEAKQWYDALDGEFTRIIATPFDQVDSCGAISIIADNLAKVTAQCRAIAGIDAKVVALRNRARECGEAKAAVVVSNAPGPIAPGALVGKVTISPPKREDHGRGSSTETTFAATSSSWKRIDGPNDRKFDVDWTYNGVPASLSPGQTVTITVTGGVTRDEPPGSAEGISLAGVVSIYGDVTFNPDEKERAKENRQADRGNKTGTYTFVVNKNAQSVEIHLGGYPAGTGAVWKYTKPVP